MVQKSETAGRRGRPRSYDPEIALERAMEAFWDGGYSGTSLDDLSARTRMNRPSLYAAFGDKQALYLKTLEEYLAERRAMVSMALRSGRPLREVLHEIYGHMIDAFLAGEHGARGCYLVGTAATESVGNPAVRELLARSVRELDEGFRAGISAAQARREVGVQLDPGALALIATGAVHTLALRARAGQPRAMLQAVADSVVALICGGRKPAKKRQPGHTNQAALNSAKLKRTFQK